MNKKGKALLALGVVLSLLVAAFLIVEMKSVDANMLKMKALKFTCPAQTAACTEGMCKEDLGTPPINACEYECVGGSYDAGTECGTNMCNGASCDQGNQK